MLPRMEVQAFLLQSPTRTYTGLVHKLHSHEINFHEINSHVVNSYKINSTFYEINRYEMNIKATLTKSTYKTDEKALH